MEYEKEGVLHVHFLHRHLPQWVSVTALIIFVFISGGLTFLYTKDAASVPNIFLQNGSNKEIAFMYGSWPALEDPQFFKTIKDEFIAERTDFIEADLSVMVMHAYQDGAVAAEVPILSKGREGSWWETPAGLYTIGSQEETHYSSFGHVYMPWSMQFQGNFFIHGWPYYPDGSPVPQGFSGGCIRLSDKDAETIYNLSKKGMPVLVFKQSFNGETTAWDYEQKKLLPDAVHYLAADIKNNFVLAEHMSAEQGPIASITKLMTALIAVEYINVERDVSITSDMLAPTSIPRLTPGKRATVLDLLSLLLIESSNEAALAVPSPLGETQFISLMNKKSTAIGMKNSQFADTSGVLAGNISTPQDLFMLAKYLYLNRSFVLHMTMEEENREAYGPSQFKNLSNLNAIPGIPGIIGAKIGISGSAEENILAVFEMDIGNETRPVAIIILGSDNIEQDMRTLFDYIIENFSISPKVAGL